MNFTTFDVADQSKTTTFTELPDGSVAFNILTQTDVLGITISNESAIQLVRFLDRVQER